ncbi:MAG: hypothetical protein ABJE95_30115, partial [Byssovorax sp.]
LKNVGTATWKAGVTKLAPTPRDKPSVLGGADWLSPTRVSTLAADVAPGAVGHFPVKITATKEGEVQQTFGLVEEAVTWFQDAPKGGGPPDKFLAIHVQVGPAQPTTSVGVGGAGGAGAGGSDGYGGSIGGAGPGEGQGGDGLAGVGGGNSGTTGGGGQADTTPPGASGSCSLGADPRDPSPLPALIGLTLLGLGMRRRRSR